MARTTTKSLAVTQGVYNRLRAKAHYGQSMSGVIQELLDLADQVEGNIKKEAPTAPQPITDTVPTP